MKALSLFREEPYQENAGHQEVTGNFSRTAQSRRTPAAGSV